MRAKLLLLVGAPFAAFAVVLIGLVVAYRASAAADATALRWTQHAAALAEVDSLATDYVDLATRPPAARSPHGSLTDVERALARARSTSRELAGYFSVVEQVDEARLAALLDELVARGRDVRANPEHAATLRAFFAEAVAPLIHRRVQEEKAGVASAVAEAEAIRSRATIGAIVAATLILVLSLAVLLRAARRFAARIAKLEQRAGRVRSGDLKPAESSDELLESSDELGRLARSIDEMVETLRQQRENQFTFLGAVAHDFRDALGVIQLTADRLQMVEVGSEESLCRALAMVQRAVARLARLANELIDASRIEVGDLQLRRELVDLRTLVRGVTEHYAATSPTHPIRVTVPVSPVTALVDPARISQVLENLVDNAIKYSPDGGPIEIDASRHGDNVVLSVTDHGPGIESSSLQTIFEPFRRVPNIPPGISLRLAVARRLVDAHDGSIDAESVVGQGSTFRVRIPLANAPEPASVAGESHAPEHLELHGASTT